MAEQINPFTHAYNLDEPLSIFKKSHSTEAALVKVQNNILLCIDEYTVVLMALLDLNANFDTCNHDILLSWHQSQFHISVTALTWFRSGLDKRTQRVEIDNSLYKTIHL